MKERIKSVILILLVLCSVGLTSVTWMEERLWPEGYSLFANVKEWPLIRNFFDSYYSEPLDNLKKAGKIVIADGNGSGSVFYNSSTAFEDVYSDISQLFSSFLKNEITVSESTVLTGENLREILDEQIMYAYVSYSVATEPNLFCRLMGVPDSDGFSDLDAVKDFFLIPTGSGSVELLALDSENGNVMRYELLYEKTEKLISAFASYAENAEPEYNCMFALEMNLDIVEEDEAVKMKTVLNPLLVLDSASTATNKRAEIIGTNPFEGDGEAVGRIIESFGINPNSIHRYIDSDGTHVCLENDSMIKIYKNGIIEYEATGASHGIMQEGGSSVYESLNSAIRFAGDVYSAASGTDFKVNVSGDLLQRSSGEMEFAFDYYFSGTPITTDITVDGEKINHAIEIKTENGYITKFRMLVREYATTESYKDCGTVYDAIDNIAELYATSEEPVTVEDIFASYREDGLGSTIMPCWTGYVDGERVIV